MDKRKQMAENQKEILALLKRPENSNCADCGISNPRWASVTIGCFLCIRCAGLHRKMGSHISKIKSVTLDFWSSEQIQTVAKTGNSLVNQRYLGSNSPNPPSDNDNQMEIYIQNKYQKSLYRSSGINIQIPKTVAPDQEKLNELISMGFKNDQENRRILALTKNNLEIAVNELLKNSSPFRASPPRISTASSPKARDPENFPTSATKRPKQADNSIHNDLLNIFGDSNAPNDINMPVKADLKNAQQTFAPPSSYAGSAYHQMPINPPSNYANKQLISQQGDTAQMNPGPFNNQLQMGYQVNQGFFNNLSHEHSSQTSQPQNQSYISHGQQSNQNPFNQPFNGYQLQSSNESAQQHNFKNNQEPLNANIQISKSQSIASNFGGSSGFQFNPYGMQPNPNMHVAFEQQNISYTPFENQNLNNQLGYSSYAYNPAGEKNHSHDLQLGFNHHVKSQEAQAKHVPLAQSNILQQQGYQNPFLNNQNQVYRYKDPSSFNDNIQQESRNFFNAQNVLLGNIECSSSTIPRGYDWKLIPSPTSKEFPRSKKSTKPRFVRRLGGFFQ
jgi:stromal membrane-associated protein